MIKSLKILKDGRIQIKHRIVIGNGDHADIDQKSPEEPQESFRVVLANLKPHFVKLCELPEGDKDKVTVTGLDFSRSGESEVLGVIFSGEKALVGSGVLELKTPKKHTEKPNENTETCHVLDPIASELVLDMVGECQSYVDGKVLQIDSKVDVESDDLPFGEEDENATD